MANTPNKNYNNQNTGANVNTWGIVLNGNLSIIDLNFGGRLNVNLGTTGSNYNVTANQAQNIYHSVAGTLTANIQYILPALGGFYFVKNLMSGAFNLTAMCSGGTVGVNLPSGVETLIWINPDDLSVRSAPMGQSLTGVGSTTGSANAQVASVVGGLGDGAYHNGELCFWRAGFNNTGAMTFGYSGIAPVALNKGSQGGTVALAANDVVAGCSYISAYNSVLNQHILINPTLNLGNVAPLNVGTNLQNNAGNLQVNPNAAFTSPTAATPAFNSNNTLIPTTAYIDNTGRNSQGAKTISTSGPSGGALGDLWYQY